jgi:hypothetical protein
MKDKTKHSKNFINITGQVFNKLTIVSFSHVQNNKYYWLCKCECGNNKIVRSDSLKDGSVKSCGCLQHVRVKKIVASLLPKRIMTWHGYGNKTHRKKGYSSWIAMKARCLNPNHEAYNNYGGRGITIDPRWLGKDGFVNFLADMGERPSIRHSLDRYPDVNGNYCKENCRWATWEQQGIAKRTSPVTENFKKHEWQKKKLYAFIHSFIKSFRLGFNRDTPLFVEHIGISFPGFRSYIESLWLPGMTWDNYGKGPGKWQFDHILPCNTFDLSKEEDRKKCFFWKNMQPMWWEDHKKKSKRVNDYVIA